jgi:HSP20 family protein
MALNPMTPLWGVGAVRRGSRGDPFLQLYRDMNRLFEDVLRRPDAEPGGSGELLLTPRINVSETEQAIRVTVELPGVKQDEIEVAIDDGMLTIRGEKRIERSEEKQDQRVVERMFGRFQRTLQLPFQPDADKVDARFENGVLKVTIPKEDQAKDTTRRVEVRLRARSKARPGAPSRARRPGRARPNRRCEASVRVFPGIPGHSCRRLTCGRHDP